MRSLEEHIKMEEHMVEDSALLLDYVYPGWESVLVQSTLDLTGYQDCILGQLYSSYGLGIAEIRESCGLPVAKVLYKTRGFVPCPYGEANFLSVRCSARRMESFWIDQRNIRVSEKNNVATNALDEELVPA